MQNFLIQQTFEGVIICNYEGVLAFIAYKQTKTYIKIIPT